VCYTNHALDQFLEDLLNIGIPASSMVRLGSKSSIMTKALTLQTGGAKLQRETFKVIDQLKADAARMHARLKEDFQQYMSSYIRWDQLLDYLEFEVGDGPGWSGAFSVPCAGDGMATVDKKGRAIADHYLVERWCKGLDAGIFRKQVTREAREIWGILPADRVAAHRRWVTAILGERAHDISTVAEQYNECQASIRRMYNQKDASVMREKRIIGCTTSAAAMKFEEIQAADADVLLVVRIRYAEDLVLAADYPTGRSGRDTGEPYPHCFGAKGRSVDPDR